MVQMVIKDESLQRSQTCDKQRKWQSEQKLFEIRTLSVPSTFRFILYYIYITRLIFIFILFQICETSVQVSFCQIFLHYLFSIF